MAAAGGDGVKTYLLLRLRARKGIPTSQRGVQDIPPLPLGDGDNTLDLSQVSRDRVPDVCVSGEAEAKRFSGNTRNLVTSGPPHRECLGRAPT